MRKFADMGINFSIIRVNNQCDKMINVMKANYDSPARQLSVQDLEKSIQTKTSVEVTKDFVKAASFILSTALGGKKGGKASKKAVKSDPLWDTKKFEVGQHFSQNAYLTVTAIEGNKITVQSSFGDEMQLSKDILEKMSSASHFAKETQMNMTELAELLESAGDTCFTVNFRKQVTEDLVQDKLQTTTEKEL